MKKILLLATGGTIASAYQDNGLTPSLNADSLLSYVSDECKNNCQIQRKQIMNVDSVNMNPSLVQKIAQTIFNNYYEFDGFVITHGTDSMGYTASLLTYMLLNLTKPIILTGSQVPMGLSNTDAVQNLSDAIRFAKEDIAGVFVFFDGKLINGTRANKFKTKSKNAFRSVNYPYVATVTSGVIEYNEEVRAILQCKQIKELELAKALCPNFIIIRLYPGMPTGIFDHLKTVFQGVIIESFGAGAVPCEDYQLNVVTKINELWDAGITVVLTTQCCSEGMYLGEYAVGKQLNTNKLIIAKDMSTEALVAKLMWALGNFNDNRTVKKFMETPVFGDITI